MEVGGQSITWLLLLAVLWFIRRDTGKIEAAIAKIKSDAEILDLVATKFVTKVENDLLEVQARNAHESIALQMENKVDALSKEQSRLSDVVSRDHARLGKVEDKIITLEIDSNHRKRIDNSGE